MKLKVGSKKYWLAIYLRVAIIVVLVFFFQSCFRFRTSDKKSIALFNANQVENKIRYIPISGTNFKIRLVGTAKKKSDTAVFFIHGAPGSADNYYAYLKDSLLLQNASLYSVDRPGYGYSKFGKAVKSIDHQTQMISQVIDSLEEQYVIVVGHSYGGPIAAYSSLKTEKVKGVIMLAPAIDPENEKIFWIARFAKWKLTKWMVPGALSVAGDEKFSHVEALREIENVWEDITVPVIHVHGTKDVIVPYENINFSKEKFNDNYLETITLEGENHFLPWSQEDLVKELIFRLLESNNELSSK